MCVCVRLTCMSQTEGPKPQIGGSVGDAAQAVLYSMDCLMHCHICKVKLWDKHRISKHTLQLQNITTSQ